MKKFFVYLGILLLLLALLFWWSKKQQSKGYDKAMAEIKQAYITVDSFKNYTTGLAIANDLLKKENELLLVLKKDTKIISKTVTTEVFDTIQVPMYRTVDVIKTILKDSSLAESLKIQLAAVSASLDSFNLVAQKFSVIDSSYTLEGSVRGFKVGIDKVTIPNITTVIDRDTSINGITLKSVFFNNSNPLLKPMEKGFVFSYVSEAQRKKDKRNAMWNGLGGGIAASAVTAIIVNALIRH